MRSLRGFGSGRRCLVTGSGSVPRAGRPRHGRTILPLILALASTGLALTTGPGAPAPNWPPDPALVRYPEEILVPQDEQTQQALRLGHPGVRELTKAHPRWKATVDPFSASVDRAFGDGIDLDEPTGREFLARHRTLMAAGLESNGSALVMNEKASVPMTDPKARVITFDLRKDGLPVIGAGLSLAVRDGKVVLISSRALRPVTTSSQPKLDAAEALASATAYARLQPGALELQADPSLAFYPRLEAAGVALVLRHHLVWRLLVKPAGAQLWEGYDVWVDARDGRVLAFFPDAQSIGSCTADPKQARGTVVGGVRPNRADDPEVVVNFPFARVNLNGTLATADINGRYLYGGGPASGSLSGDIFRVHCANCIDPSQAFASADASGDVDYGTGGGSNGPPVFGNGLSTLADRSAYYHLHQARQLMAKWDSIFFDEIEVFVNLGDTCNAFSQTSMVVFFGAGGGCRNTGEIRDVMQHELGHNWDRFDGNDITNGGMSEWKADMFALSIGGDSCMAESFHVSTGFPSPTCSGVRDIDEKVVFGGTKSIASNPCGGEVHCVGEIAGQASWHLLNNLMTGADYITGAPLPAGNPALPVERARWILERLLIGGGPPMQVLNPASAGVSIYDAIMLMDDDDANLSNGTPHAAYINPAFTHHGLAETPLVADSADCPALSDPIVNATIERDPSTGLAQVRLDWTPVGGATSFDVYRNTRAGDGFLPLARNVTAGPFIDAGPQIGATYRYFVAAVRRTGCADISPGGNIVTLTITPPDLKVLSATFSETPGGSDGDGRLEPGERVKVHVTLREIGGAAGATGVTASLTSASASSPTTAGGPVSFGTVPAGGSMTASSDFEVYVGPSQACGSSVHLTLSASGNEGCWLDSFNLPIDATVGCAVTPAAFVEVVPGSLHVMTSTGDTDTIPDNCEVTTAGYQIRNTGSLMSAPATSTVTTSAPGVTFSPPAVCSVAGLAGGASSACQFSFSLGGATSAGVPFTLTATSSSNAAPSVVDARLGAETNPPVFTTQGYGFEGSLQGWTAQKFSLSSAHVFTGAQSAHAGSTTTPNICAKLTSPAFLLNPAGGSTLGFRLYAEIEPPSDQYYDRANVHIIDIDTGVHTIMPPSSGLAYNTASDPNLVGLCHNNNESGWAGILGGFNLETFNLSAFAGRRIRVEINYDSDEGDNRDGIYIDDVTLTNAASATLPADLQTDTCVVPEVSAPVAPVPLDLKIVPASTVRFTWQDLGAGYQYNLYAGTIGSYYSHGAGQISCSGLGAGVSCDGSSCALDKPNAALPGGDLYFLVTATGFGQEGTSGFSSAGLEREPAQNSCTP